MDETSIFEIPNTTLLQAPRVFSRGHRLGEQRRARRRRRGSADRRDRRRQDGQLPPLHGRGHLSQRSREPPSLGHPNVRFEIEKTTGCSIKLYTIFC